MLTNNTTIRPSALQLAYELSVLSPRAVVLLDDIRAATARGQAYPDHAEDAETLETILCEPIACGALIEVTADGWRALPVE